MDQTIVCMFYIYFTPTQGFSITSIFGWLDFVSRCVTVHIKCLIEKWLIPLLGMVTFNNKITSNWPPKLTSCRVSDASIMKYLIRETTDCTAELRGKLQYGDWLCVM